eukprot:scaffold34638_cov161-Amphora_coffeaeformis.AAC.5
MESPDWHVPSLFGSYHALPRREFGMEGAATNSRCIESSFYQSGLGTSGWKADAHCGNRIMHHNNERSRRETVANCCQNL